MCYLFWDGLEEKKRALVLSGSDERKRALVLPRQRSVDCGMKRRKLTGEKHGPRPDFSLTGIQIH